MLKTVPYILCVDDEPINLELLKSFLGELYEVECVDNGLACLDSVAQRRPDLILLDVVMPVMDGISCCKKLKASPWSKHIPIIVLSANSAEDEMTEMFELGVDSYITKPFREKRLLKVVSDYLSVSSKI